jgi:hypothetical protein
VQTETSEELLHLSAGIERGEIEPVYAKPGLELGLCQNSMEFLTALPKHDHKCVGGTNTVDEDMPSIGALFLASCSQTGTS